MSTNLDTGTGSQPATRPHVAVEAPPVGPPQDPGLGSVTALRYDNFNADVDPTRSVVGWNEGGAATGYQTWLPAVSPSPGPPQPQLAESVLLTATTALLVV